MNTISVEHFRFIRTIGVLYIFNGISMFVVWPILFISDQVPELHTQFVYLCFHLVAEFATATICVITGIGLIFIRNWAKVLYYFASGLSICAGYLAITRCVFESDISNSVIVILLFGINIINIYLLIYSYRIKFSSIKENSSKIIIILNGALIYTLVNLAGFMADKDTGYAYGYMSMILLLTFAIAFINSINIVKHLKI